MNKQCTHAASRAILVSLLVATVSVPAAAEATFEDVTKAAGVKGGEHAAWGDYNNDGHVDVATNGGLLRNNGDGTFTDVQMDPRPVGGGAWGDVNNDGRLDFYRFAGEGTLYVQTSDGKFTRAEGFMRNPHRLCRSASWADANGDGFLDLYLSNYEAEMSPKPDFYIESSGALTWKDAVTFPTSQPWSTRGVNWADFDNDGDQDLYISHYRLMPNHFYINEGSGKLTNEAWARGTAGTDTGAGHEPYNKEYIYTGHTIGSCWGDLNNDGNLDLAVINFSHPPAFQNRVHVLINSGPPNYTFTNTNQNAGAGIHWQESYAKGALGDFDNDGDLDLYITTVYSGDNGTLFANDGTGRFTDVGDATGTRGCNSYQASWADYDNDGDLDLLAGGKLLRNNAAPATNAWLKVKAVGDAGSNGAAIGARITVSAGERAFIREVEGGNSGNQNDLTVHFGLGPHTGPVTVRVRFPSGKTGVWTSEARTTLIVRESEARPEE